MRWGCLVWVLVVLLAIVVVVTLAWLGRANGTSSWPSICGLVAGCLYDTLTSPYTARLSPDFAAAHLLAAGADGPALRELAALSERDFPQPPKLLAAAYEVAAHLLVPVQALRDAQDPDQDAAWDTLVLAWSSSSIGDRIDELGAFLDDLANAALRLGLGEIEGPVDEAEEQVAFCYGEICRLCAPSSWRGCPQRRFRTPASRSETGIESSPGIRRWGQVAASRP